MVACNVAEVIFLELDSDRAYALQSAIQQYFGNLP